MSFFQSGQQRALVHQRTKYTQAAGYSYQYTLWYVVGGLGSLIGLFVVCSPAGLAIWSLLTGRGSWSGPLLVLIFAAGVVVVFLAAVGLAFLIRREERRRAKALALALDERGVIVDGTIIDRWGSFGDQGTSDYFRRYLAYRYGQGEVRQVVSWWTYWHTHIGDAVQVRYLPDQPHVARLEDRR
ncbi:MAG TPA: hypothetical protein VFS21_19515 [Roseiflexaceae bacterium]|nr:hypothetical protein [Roseiflexaceae bacterium]